MLPKGSSKLDWAVASVWTSAYDKQGPDFFSHLLKIRITRSILPKLPSAKNYAGHEVTRKRLQSSILFKVLCYLKDLIVLLILTNNIFKGLFLTWLFSPEFLSSDWLFVFSKILDQKQFCSQWISKSAANKLQNQATELLFTVVHVKIFKIIFSYLLESIPLLLNSALQTRSAANSEAL